MDCQAEKTSDGSAFVVTVVEDLETCTRELSVKIIQGQTTDGGVGTCKTDSSDEDVFYSQSSSGCKGAADPKRTPGEIDLTQTNGELTCTETYTADDAGDCG